MKYQYCINVIFIMFWADITRFLQYFRNLSNRFINILAILQDYNGIFSKYSLNIMVLCGQLNIADSKKNNSILCSVGKKLDFLGQVWCEYYEAKKSTLHITRDKSPISTACLYIIFFITQIHKESVLSP